MGNALKYETDTTTPQSYSKSIFLSLYNLKAQEVDFHSAYETSSRGYPLGQLETHFLFRK